MDLLTIFLILHLALLDSQFRLTLLVDLIFHLPQHSDLLNIVLEKQIDGEIKKVEQEINDLKKTAPEKINKIAIEMQC